jgi:REP element-mobilizing transposase RayT
MEHNLMPRMLRLEYPGSIAHVMARGIEGRDIFRSDDDRHDFLMRLKSGLRATGYKCLAWCLMKNHYHLVLRTNENPMSSLMRPLNGGYARRFNAASSRRGYLFQDRFKSVLCQDQEYTRQLIRYVHLNPVRKGLVRSIDELKKYRWCGHAWIIGLKDACGADFQDRRECLRRFGRTESAGIAEYLLYLSAAMEIGSTERAGWFGGTEESEITGSSKGWPAVIGDPEFARTAMDRHAVGAMRKHRKADYPDVLGQIANETCRTFHIKKEELFHRGRSNNRSIARAAFCHQANTAELIPLSVIAGYLGINIAPVSMLAKRGKDHANRNMAAVDLK